MGSRVFASGAKRAGQSIDGMIRRDTPLSEIEATGPS